MDAIADEIQNEIQGEDAASDSDEDAQARKARTEELQKENEAILEMIERTKARVAALCGSESGVADLECCHEKRL